MTRNSGLRGEEIGDGFYRGGNVGIGDVGVNFSHGLIVCPAADFHSDLFGYAKMIGEGAEGMAQAVCADLRKAIGGTDAVNLCPDGIWVTGDNELGIAGRGGKKIFQARYHDRYRAPGGLIFIVRLIDDLVIFVVDGRTTDVQKAAFQTNIAPLQAHDLRAPERVEAEKGRDFAGLAFNSGKKDLNLLRLQERMLFLRELGEVDRERFARLMLHVGRDERPRVFYRFRGYTVSRYMAR